MFSYLQVPFLQALGYAIANSLWQVFLLWLIVIVVNGMAKQSPVIKHITAVCAQAGSFVWFVTTLQFYYRHCLAASVQAEQMLLHQEVVYTQTSFVNDSVLSYLIKAEETLPYLSIAYLFLLLLLLVKWFNAFRFTKQLGTVGLQPAEASWQRFVNETADQLGIVQNVTVYLSSLAKSPLTIGYIKPLILLPIASINQLTAEQLEAVLLHELAHIRRSDYLINLLMSIIEIILFFNPFTRLLSRQIKEERENCCDDWVLQFQYNAAMYAEALLRIAYYQNSTGLQINAAGQKGALLQRVKRMLQPQKTFNYKHQIIALFIITGLLFSISWLQPVQNRFDKQPISSASEVNKIIMVTPLTAQVDNPFFNAASFFSKSLQKDVASSLAEANKTLQDSFTQTSLREAHKVLSQAIPDAMATVSSVGWQKIVDDAKEDATKSLAAIDWQNVQNDAPELYDSLFLIHSINSALDVNINNAEKNDKVAQDQLATLGKMKLSFNFSTDLLQQLTTNALASLQNFDFKSIQDSVARSTKVLNGLLLKQQKAGEEFRKKQKEWIRKAEADYRRSAEAIKKISPILAPVPPPPDIQTGSDEDGVMSYTDFAPVIAPPVLRSQPYHIITRHDNASKTIQIINNSDSTTLNIIIEVAQ